MMIANISPNSGACENTLNTLRYADRVKELKKGQGAGAAGGAKAYDAYMPHQGKQGKRNFDVDQSAAVFQPAAQLPPPAAPSAAASAAQAGPAKAGKGMRSSLAPAPALEQKQPFVKPLASAIGRGGMAGGSNGGGGGGGGHGVVSDPSNEPDALEKTYMDLGSTILREEESIVEAHRAQIDTTMKGVKEEMELLKRFDTNGHSVDEYVDRLDDLLARKIQGIQELKHKLQMFKKHLKQEEELSSSLNRKRNGGGGGGSWGGGGGQAGYDDDDQPPQQQRGRDPSYPHLHPLPNSNYNR
jgi:kinesin family protein 2/24